MDDLGQFEANSQLFWTTEYKLRLQNVYKQV